MSAPQGERGPEVVRGKLIDAALELLREKAPPNITAEEIAHRARVNRGQIHHLFRTKDRLLATALSEAGERWATTEDSLIADADMSQRAALWRAMAYVAISDDWAELDPRLPAFAAAVDQVAEKLGKPVDDTEVLARAAILESVRFGWGVIHHLVERSLETYGGDVVAIRGRINEIADDCFVDG